MHGGGDADHVHSRDNIQIGGAENKAVGAQALLIPHSFPRLVAGVGNEALVDKGAVRGGKIEAVGEIVVGTGNVPKVGQFLLRGHGHVFQRVALGVQRGGDAAHPRLDHADHIVGVGLQQGVSSFQKNFGGRRLNNHQNSDDDHSNKGNQGNQQLCLNAEPAFAAGFGTGQGGGTYGFCSLFYTLHNLSPSFQHRDVCRAVYALRNLML
ncbi:hypothetical protein SDC9_72376 [bioreactor metagenome]|uniref:Uncharacterized protein n=1 Tax=bioreactor metagenome TaxID=1076179 RepID=A0A644YBE6_9ZZZZ